MGFLAARHRSSRLTSAAQLSTRLDLCGCWRLFPLKTLPMPPDAHRKDEQYGIAPEPQGRGVGQRQQVGIDCLEHVSKAGRQLQAADPQWPETIRSESDVRVRDPGRDIDGEDSRLDRGIADGERRTERRCGVVADKEGKRDDARIRLAT